MDASGSYFDIHKPRGEIEKAKAGNAAAFPALLYDPEGE
jgi:hypothetical protein